MVLIGLEARVPKLNNNRNGSSDIGKKNSPSFFLSKFLFGPFSFGNTCFGPRLYFVFILISDLIEERAASKWQRNEKVISWAWFRAQKRSLLMVNRFLR